MKIAALIVVSFLAGWMGLVFGMLIGGLAVHAPDFTASDVLGPIAIGTAFAVTGRAFGRKLGWIPGAVYCTLIAVLGGLLPITYLGWDKVIAAWICVLCIATVYWLWNLWIAGNALKNPSGPPHGKAP
jgi:hypothetical protein